MRGKTLLQGIAPPKNRWDETAARATRDPLDMLVYRSNLLGADRAVANQGGGNTSVKQAMDDHTGRSVETLWVKGSGTDLRTITREGFAGLRLNDLLLLRPRDALDDASMVAYLLQCAVRLAQPRPSIETLLHAFIPAMHVDHTHPDAIIALTAAPNGKELVEETFGTEVVWLPYERPGFAMSKRTAALLDEHPAARAVFLEKHGLVTWGETSQESYQSTLEFIRRAAEAIAQSGAERLGLGGSKFEQLDDESAESMLVRALPELRGALLSDSAGAILEVDRSPDAIEFASSQRAPDVSQVGAPCPDHLVVTKHKPLMLEFDPARDDGPTLATAFRDGVDSYSAWYRSYYTSNVSDEAKGFPIDPAGPRVVLVPGVGLIAAGLDAGRARVARDLYHRAIVVENAADALGGFRSLSEKEAFDVEYWPLERYKLAQAPPRGELAGRVAVVTGGASGIGRAAAQALAKRGAHVVVGDRNLKGAEGVAATLTTEFGVRRAIAVGFDVTDEAAVVDVFRRTVLEYGGIDILVASAGLATSAPVIETTADDWQLNFDVLARGYFLAAREALKVMIRQGAGGSIVFIGSKNALVAGANASAYSSAKAASLHLARCLAEEGGPHGIRVNTVNPDAVIEGSSIWSSEWKAERASTYGIDEDDLQSFYSSRTKLGVAVLPEDVAEAVAFFAGPQSMKSTGNVINVDGGVTAAYTR